MKLTDVAIRKTKPKAKAYKVTDSQGLFLLITPSGGKLWRWKYRFGGKEKLMALGQYPETSLAEARDKHFAARKLLHSGTDPMAERKAAKAAAVQCDENDTDNPFATVATKWHEHWSHGKSQRYIDTVKRRIDTNIIPVLGNRPVADIKASEIIKTVKNIEGRDKTDMAKRILENINQIYRYAVAHEFVETNPIGGVKPSDFLKSHKTVNFARVDQTKLQQLLKDIEVYCGTPLTRLAIKLMALTFVRTSELIEAPWSEIDFDNSRWNIPAERMKMDSPHIVPLSRQAIEVLQLLHTITGEGQLIFPGDRANKSMSSNTILMALMRMGYKGEMTGHGFRGLASTILHENDFSHEWIELQLAHQKRDKVSGAYNHALYLKQRTEMMQWWADYLEHTLRGGKVLPFARYA